MITEPVRSVPVGKYGRNNNVRLVNSGSTYFRLLEDMIVRAEHVVHLQVYIFKDDRTGFKVIELLAQAAQRGIKVYVLVDGYASQYLPEQLILWLRRSGVFFKRFEPIFKSRHFYFGRRLHHKVLVVDGREALVGGINIADQYNDTDDGPAWLDFALHVKGATANELEHICCDLWNSHTKTIRALPGPPDGMVHRPAMAVRVRRNDWTMRQNQIWKSYTNLLGSSREEIIIACSYFLPGYTFRKLLAAAARKGVSIRVVVAGRSDVFIAKQAERFLYRWMLQNGIRVFEYQDGILHAKIAVSDSRLMTIGSYNINNISAYASIELNLDVRNKPFVATVRDQLDGIIRNDCLEITREDDRTNNNKLKRLWQYCCYELIRLILHLLTFYFKQERNY